MNKVKQVSHAHLEKKRKLAKITVSRQAMASGSDELVTRVQKALKSDATYFGYYSLELEESKDVSDTAQLAIVLRGVIKS
jgi:hypothetical protein